MIINGKICQHCHSELNNVTISYVCSVCEVVQHRECWIRNNGCTTSGCQGTPIDSRIAAEPKYQITDNASIYCPSCGHTLSIIYKICPHCGTSLIDNTHKKQQSLSAKLLGRNTSNTTEKIILNKNNTDAPHVAKRAINIIGGVSSYAENQISSSIINPSLSGIPSIISGKSMKWFKIFTLYVVYIWLVLGSNLYLRQLSKTFSQYIDGGIGDSLFKMPLSIIFIPDIVMQIVTVILLIYSISPLKKFRRTGYIIIVTYFIVRLIYPFIYYIIVYSFVTSSIDFSFYFGQNLIDIVFCILNLVYFKKREHIFSN